MDIFHQDDFGDSIDDMCDDALRRMRSFQEGGLSIMHPGDKYYSEVLRRIPALEIIEFDTVTRANILDVIHADVLDGEIPEYFRDILSGAVIALARHASFIGRGQDTVVPNLDSARSKIDESLLMKASELKDRKITFVQYDLGSLGSTALILQSIEDNNWTLTYEAHWRVSLAHG